MECGIIWKRRLTLLEQDKESRTNSDLTSLGSGDPGIQTASHTVLVTLATHLSLERWPVQTGLQKQASGAEAPSLHTPGKELVLAFLIWVSQPPKFLGPSLLTVGVIQGAHSSKNKKSLEYVP